MQRFFTAWMVMGVMIFSPFHIKAQSYSGWYNNAQERIDTLRKGEFGIKIKDENGNPYSGPVSVRMAKHEFPFGISFDFYEGAASMGNSYSTAENIQASADEEIYKTERWSDYLAYVFPVEKDKEYKLTLKFAEIYFDSGNLRTFSVFVEDQLFLSDYDVYTEAGGKNIARDTSMIFSANDNFLNIEIKASLDNASIKGIVVEELGGTNILRLNCGGAGLTTSSGNQYVSEEGYFDPEVNTVASKEQWMQAAMYKYFNYGVSGNSFKWSGIQPRHVAPDYSDFNNAVKWTQKVGWDLRAHTLLWGGNDAHSMPDWIRELPTPQAITDTCKMRVIREMTHFKGIIKEYDVINEPLTNHADWLRNTVGDSILWNCFKWAHEADPDAEIYINDYNVEYNWGQAEEYRDLILKIKEMGGPVSGVGLQAHFWDCCRPGVDELVKNLNIIAEAGLPMRLTEYDWGTNLTEKQQVDDFVKVATIAFSHPSVNGMICWGLSDDGAWRENTGFFDANHKPKLAADTLLYYTKTKWATNFDTLISDDNILILDAYYGDYTIDVEIDGVIRVFNVPCTKSNKDSIFVLNASDSFLKGAQLLRTELKEDDLVQLVFDKPIEPASIKASDFKFFSTREIGLNAVEVDSENQNALLLSISKAVLEDDFISVSYFPGSMKAADGSIALAFGPEAVAIPVSDVGNALISSGPLKVFPNPATNQITVQYPADSYKVLIYNSLGVKVYGEEAFGEQLVINVNEFKRGIYLIKLMDSGHQIATHKVVLK